MLELTYLSIFHLAKTKSFLVARRSILSWLAARANKLLARKCYVLLQVGLLMIP